ncbi:uncharacterized protein BO88DRAFT_352072, partial [Aspergillus vadensis CBS 113365]
AQVIFSLIEGLSLLPILRIRLILDTQSQLVLLSFKGDIVRSEDQVDKKLPKVNFGKLLVHYTENNILVDYPS